ncbi:hypothetical protein niasHT_026034 [Heterodera trifolii]|uniref:C2H2-type domain-containing protein n=1 Tax=Heterodera trifolii TaxID=157864 RepID=A0ABD2KJD3_9BILA
MRQMTREVRADVWVPAKQPTKPKFLFQEWLTIGITTTTNNNSEGFFRECAECNKAFRNNDCYHHHLNSNFCALSKRCKKCGVIWDTKVRNRNGRRGHICDERYCQTCNNFHNMERGCFIQPIEPREIDLYCIMVFDLETMQHHALDPLQPKKENISQTSSLFELLAPAVLKTAIGEEGQQAVKSAVRIAWSLSASAVLRILLLTNKKWAKTHWRHL